MEEVLHKKPAILLNRYSIMMQETSIIFVTFDRLFNEW